MAYWLRALTSLSEDPGSRFKLSTSQLSVTPVPGIPHIHTDIHAGKAPVHIK